MVRCLLLAAESSQKLNNFIPNWARLLDIYYLKNNLPLQSKSPSLMEIHSIAMETALK